MLFNIQQNYNYDSDHNYQDFHRLCLPTYLLVCTFILLWSWCSSSTEAVVSSVVLFYF